jgi:hypothetical protein
LDLESGNGAIEAVGIDNFRLTSAVPEPGSVAMTIAVWPWSARPVVGAALDAGTAVC